MPCNLNLTRLITTNNYFIAEIRKREIMSIMLSKYITRFAYLDKALLVLSAPNGSVFIALFVIIIDAPVGIVSATLFSIPTLF